MDRADADMGEALNAEDLPRLAGVLADSCVPFVLIEGGAADHTGGDPPEFTWDERVCRVVEVAELLDVGGHKSHGRDLLKGRVDGTGLPRRRRSRVGSGSPASLTARTVVPGG